MLDIQDLFVDGDLVNEVYSQGTVDLSQEDTLDGMPVNSYIVLRDFHDKKHTALVQYVGNNTWKRIRPNKELECQGLLPRDARQAAMMNSLADEKILVNIVVGAAGTGKTTLALAYALEQYQHHDKPIYMSKPTATVGEGKAFGPVPGDIQEKYAPYLASYEIALKRLLGKNGAGQVEMMKRRKAIDFVPVEMVRGSEFANCTFILDEAQNLSWHELKTLVSRMGEDTTLIILGDLLQIDTGCFPEETGLYKLLASDPYKRSGVGSSIQLNTQYRSPITQLVAEVDKWVLDEARAERLLREEG